MAKQETDTVDDMQEQRETKPKKAAAQETDTVDDGLVEMIKGSEKLKVHPSTVAAHQEAGWKAV